MGHYRARDLLLVPSLLSLSRLPLAYAFTRSLDHPLVALGVLALAGLSDILDGYYARKLGQATPTGAVVDGVTDKLFVGSVVVALVEKGAFTWPEALVLALREIVELPLVLWWALHKKKRKARAEDPKANRLGKIATVLAFATVSAALFGSPLRLPLLFLTGAAGLVAAITYFQRELRAVG
jgi:CDP-diacylglycerol--glycerol-3-phosphate 3-phosphatidyltransferase/cardiolipin synthase